jgi:predicted RNA-binding protein with PIN domain
MRILIDGYNLMHAIGFRGSLAAPGQLERARLEMLEKLASYLAPSLRRETVVIFDQGHRSSQKASSFVRQEIRVEFAVGYEDADSMIETMIQQFATPQTLLVVSSDHRIQTAARRRNARFIDSDVWIDQLEHPATSTRDSPAPSRSSKPKPDGDIQFWLDWLQADKQESKEDGDRIGEESKTSAAETQSDCEEFFNPFPKGYGEDLLDDE